MAWQFRWQRIKQPLRDRRPTVAATIALAAIALLLLRIAVGKPSDAVAFDRHQAEVVWSDGELVADVDGQKASLALLGIDPAPSATDALQVAVAEWLANHDGRARLVLADVPVHDSQGRLLAYVFPTAGGITLNEQLVRDGHAFADRRFDHPYAATLVTAELAAIVDRNGVWSSLPNDPPMPTWRRAWRQTQKDRQSQGD